MRTGILLTAALVVISGTAPAAQSSYDLKSPDNRIEVRVRTAGQVLAEQAAGDLHTFFQRLREAQKQYPERLVQAPLRPFVSGHEAGLHPHQ